MFKKIKQIAFPFLLLSGLFLMAHLVLPHHHHQNGSVVVCLSGENDLESDKSQDHPPCQQSNECWGDNLSLNFSEDHKGHKHCSDCITSFIPCKHLLTSLVLSCMANVYYQPILYPQEQEYVYPSSVSLHSQYISKALSLRGPPSFLS